MTKFGPWKVWCAGGGRWKRPGARLEVGGVERVGVDVAVPPDHVERVAVEDVGLQPVAHAQRDRPLAGLVDRLERGRPMEVALRVRRVLEQLAVAVAVAVRGLDLARGVEAHPVLLGALRRLPAVGRPARDHDVVLLAVGDGAEHRPHDARAAVDVDDLVALAVAVEAVHRLRRLADRGLDVAVPHQQAPPGDRVAPRRDRAGVGQPVHVGVGHPLLALDRPERPDPVEPAGGVQVVEDRLVAAEALVAEDLLDEQAPIAVAPAPHLGVTLGRDLSEAHVPHG